MPQFLVTGAAGFIGSHLCERLLQDGHHVRGLDSFTSFYDADLKHSNLSDALGHPRFELVPKDLLGKAVDSAIRGIDTVVHLAGEPGVTMSWGDDFARYLRRNVLATQHLLEAAVDAGVRRLVFASSSSVYGRMDAKADGQVRREPKPASPYGVTKLAAETLVGAYAQQHGLEAVALRYFSVYGPRQRPDMAVHRFIEALLDGRPLTVFGDGRQTRDFTYVDDVVDATVRAATADLPPAAVFDIASSRPVTIESVIGFLRSLTGEDQAPVEQAARPAGDVRHTEGNIRAARDLLGWQPRTDLENGLRRQVAWHRERRRRAGEAGRESPSALAASRSR